MLRTKLAVTTAVCAIAAVFASVALANPAAVKPAVKKPAAVKPVTVNVTGTEFSFTASKKTLPVNKPIVFKFKNVGDEVHDLAFINPEKKTPFLTGGKAATLKVTFKKKGRYQAICTVGEHFLRGMKIDFTVK